MAQSDLIKVCLWCEKQFVAKTARTYCCPGSCWKLHVARDPMDRFWAKVKKTEGCWEWTAAIGQWGYGNFMLKGKYMKAHRMAWIFTNGEIPAGMLVCHHCDNPKCVRPEHLFLGTDLDNSRDKYSKGREGVSRGESIHTALLSREQVLEIRTMSNLPARVVAAKYGVTRCAIQDIRDRRSWAWL